MKTKHILRGIKVLDALLFTIESSSDKIQVNPGPIKDTLEELIHKLITNYEYANAIAVITELL